MVNFIKSRFIIHRFFKALYRELGSDHEVLSYHSEVRWLSRGEILKQLQELKQEVSLFLKNKNSFLAEKIESESFLLGLFYLADIFGHINNVNRAMQRPGVTIMDAAEKLNAFLLKLFLWKCRLELGDYANFPLLEDLIWKDKTRKESHIFISMRKKFCSHLNALQTFFEGYFNLGSLKDEAWIRNPFLIDLNSIDDEDPNKYDFIDLRTSKLLQIEFNATSLKNSWCSQQHSYQLLAKQAISTLIPFATTYRSEAAFSALVTIKTKQRNHLDFQHDMRVALSKAQPQFSVLVQKRQQQASH